MTQAQPEHALRAQEEQLQIADLAARFADAANRHDWKQMAQLYAEDAIWETSAGTLGFHLEGRPAILRFLLENPKNVEVVAYSSTPPFIETISDGRARTRLNMTEYLRDLATGEVKRIVGVYTDELVKREGHWQFSHRAFTLQIAFDEKPSSLSGH